MKYIKIKVQWIYLYRTVNSTGITFDFHLEFRRPLSPFQESLQHKIQFH
ncbi:DDE-type integrase/transposase/recombinase [Bacillus thuringiensis]